MISERSFFFTRLQPGISTRLQPVLVSPVQTKLCLSPAPSLHIHTSFVFLLPIPTHTHTMADTRMVIEGRAHKYPNEPLDQGRRPGFKSGGTRTRTRTRIIIYVYNVYKCIKYMCVNMRLVQKPIATIMRTSALVLLAG